MLFNQTIFRYAFLMFIYLFSAAFLAAQTNQVDLSFNPMPSKEVTSNILYGNLTLQPDGKVIIFGDYRRVGDEIIGYINRVNPDGTLDSTFNCSACSQMRISSVVVQPDGKIIIAGIYENQNGSNRGLIIRVNSDGSLDSSFTSPFNENQTGLGYNTSAKVFAVQPDGKLLVSYRQSFQGFSQEIIYRLNTDGSFDKSFTPIELSGGRTNSQFLSELKLLPDGKILIGGGNSGINSVGFLHRFNPNGTRDTTFESPVFTTNNTSGGSYVLDFDARADGKIVVTGRFTTVNGINRTNVVRLEAAGNVDLSFNPPNLFNIGEDGRKVEFLPNSQILINTSSRFIKLFTDGSADLNFNSPSNLSEISNWDLDASNKIILFGTISGAQKYIRLNFDGSLDPTFDVAVTTRGTVTALEVQPDGKVLVGGDFDRINGRVRHKIARLNADGSLDTTFDAENRFNLPPEVITLQPDGKILVGGGAVGLVAPRIVRLNSDGSLDATFNVQLSETSSIVYDIALDTDGRILIGGIFSNVNGASRTSLARLNSDGSLDASFNPIFGGNPVIRAVLVLANGQILVGGSFTGVNGFNRMHLVRLNADGSLDTSFNAGNTLPVREIVQQANGQFVVLHTNTISRINADGSRDERFSLPVFEDSRSVSAVVKTMFVLPDSIVVGGRFDSVNGIPRNNLARITMNGGLDLNFFPSGTNGEVNKIVNQPTGRLIVGGDFSRIGNVERFSIARITTAPVRFKTKFDFDGDGRADFAIYRPSTNEWYILRSSDFQLAREVFGIAGDIPAPADFDGDGRTDIAIFRPSSGDWWYKSSVDGQQKFVHFGKQGDVPRPSDFTGDGRDDFVVFRPSENYWYRANSVNGQPSNLGFGTAGDLPLIADFNGDGRSDPAIFRPSTGNWWWQSSSDNVQRATQWGIATDIPAPADYDGDGKTDFAVYRPSTGVWYILNSSNGSFTIINFGTAEDKPIPADYDGDGRTDIAVFRPSTGVWYLLRSTAGFGAINLGVGTDVPIPNAFTLP